MRWFRIAGVAGIGFFLAAAFTPLPNFLSRRLATPARLEPADAIVVLGGGVWSDGKLTNASLRRALHGMTLYRKGLAPLLVFLGPGGHNGPPEAELRAVLARDLGISAPGILTESNAWTTREEAARTRDLLASRGIRRILLVTNSQHLTRAQPLFERTGFEVLPAPIDDFPAAPERPESRLELTRRFFKELLGRLYYRLAGYL